MKRLVPSIFLIVLALALSGCWNGRVLFFLEQPAWASSGGGPLLLARLIGDSLRSGVVPTFSIVSPPAEPVSRLLTELSAHRYRTAVIGPFLSAEWRSYVERFPSTRFVLIGGLSGVGARPPNIVSLTFDRGPAFRASGFAAALAVRAQFGEATGNLGSRIGALVDPRGDLSDAEVDAFGAGVEEGLDGERPVVRRFAAGADRMAAQTAVKQMRQDGVEILLLGMGSLDPACLEALKDVGGSAVVADWAGWRPFPRQVFLSVEVDVEAGIDRALRSRLDIEGPVGVVAGSAREIPREARNRLGVK